jgi:hypothetical protein
MEKKKVELINLLPSQVEFFVFHLCWQTLTWLVYAHFPIPFLSTQSSLIVFDVFNHRAQLVSFSSSSRPIPSLSLTWPSSIARHSFDFNQAGSYIRYAWMVIAYNNHRRCVCFFFFFLFYNWSAQTVTFFDLGCNLFVVFCFWLVCVCVFFFFPVSCCV